jgi:hypothetical protein
MTNFLDQVDAEENIEINLPSLGKIAFKPLSTKQLKEILQSVVDTSIGANSFLKVANSIVGNNVDPIDGPLNIRDRDIILYTLRRECISDEWKGKTLPVLTPDKGFLRDKEVKFRNYKLSLTTPTIHRESLFITQIQPQQGQNLENIVGDLFIKEITKYTVGLSFKELECDFTQLETEEQVKLIEKLPPGLVHKAAKTIEEAQKEWNEVLTVDGETISIDPEFFA